MGGGERDEQFASIRGRSELSAGEPGERARAGRDKFLEEVHAWVRTYGGKILGQLRRMGSSPDWRRLVGCHACADWMQDDQAHAPKGH